MTERIWKNRAVMVCHFTVGLNGAFVQQSPAGKTQFSLQSKDPDRLQIKFSRIN